MHETDLCFGYFFSLLLHHAADRLERALSESNSERGMLRQKMKQADIENNQLTKRVQLQHNQRVELSVQLATTRSEVETSNNRYEEALSDLAVSKQSWKELDGMNTELQVSHFVSTRTLHRF